MRDHDVAKREFSSQRPEAECAERTCSTTSSVGRLRRRLHQYLFSVSAANHLYRPGQFRFVSREPKGSPSTGARITPFSSAFDKPSRSAGGDIRNPIPQESQNRSNARAFAPFLPLLQYRIIRNQDYWKTSLIKQPVFMSKTLGAPRQQRLQELLAGVRKAKKLTQIDVAERLGRPQSFVAKYEDGERRLDIVEFVEVAKRSIWILALCSPTFFTPRSFAPSVSRPPFEAGTGIARPPDGQERWGRVVSAGKPQCRLISMWLAASATDRHRWHSPRQRRSIRKRDGVVPVSFRKLSVKWLWLAKPTASATSAIDRSAPSSSSLARRMRRSIR